MKAVEKLYLQAIKIIKAGNMFVKIKDIASEYPSNFDYKAADDALSTASIINQMFAEKTHPEWKSAVLRGESADECLRIWKKEGGSKYVNSLPEDYNTAISIIG